MWRRGVCNMSREEFIIKILFDETKGHITYEEILDITC